MPSCRHKKSLLLAYQFMGVVAKESVPCLATFLIETTANIPIRCLLGDHCIRGAPSYCEVKKMMYSILLLRLVSGGKLLLGMDTGCRRQLAGCYFELAPVSVSVWEYFL